MSDFRYYRNSNFPPIVRSLIIINVIVWLIQLLVDKRYDLTDHLALYPIDSPYFRPYEIATHMFAHASYTPFGQVIFYHILFNMLALWMFGKNLENVWGGKRFLLFYILCGVGAAVMHLLIEHITGSGSAAIGASGAVMGVVVGFGYLFPNTELYIMPIPVPIKAKWAIIGFVLLDLFGGISGTDNVAHFAHLGGALTGFILVLIWNKTDRKRFY